MTTTDVRKVARGKEMKRLARLGLASRAAIYLLIGWIALLLAQQKSGAEADQRGALQELARHNGGAILLWVLFAGLVCYAVWRLSEAAFGVVGEGMKAGPRVQSFVRACIYAFLAASALTVVTHSGSQSQAGQQELWTAETMSHPGGRWAVGLVGAIVLIAGLVMVYEGVTRKFEKYLALQQMSSSTRRVVEVLGVVGTVARGLVFAMAGFFVIHAAWSSQPHQAQGLDYALRRLLEDTGGSVLLTIVALGFIAFGIYGFAEAKWRRT
jgi:hypothetical protein